MIINYLALAELGTQTGKYYEGRIKRSCCMLGFWVLLLTVILALILTRLGQEMGRTICEGLLTDESFKGHHLIAIAIG